MTPKISTAILALGVASSFFLFIGGGTAAETHVDCDKVMHELVNGKSALEVANDLGTSASAVYDCENAKAATERQGMPSAVPSASVSSPPTSPR
jgi:hypothetical protein